MTTSMETPAISHPIHEWLKKVHLVYAPGPLTPLLEKVAKGLLHHFRLFGHEVQETGNQKTDVILTSAPYRVPLNWRNALLFTARRKFGIQHTPTIFTLMQATPAELQVDLEYFERVLEKAPPDPKDYDFPGLAPRAYLTLHEQGQRGGPILALARLLQSQAKSIRLLLVIGEEQPEYAYLFDLVGAHPRIDASDPEVFYTDLVNRMVTVLSTYEVTNHHVQGEPLALDVWRQLESPTAMRKASLQLGKRDFFTKMVRIADLVHVPAVDDAISRQYSEGCFATWEPSLNALIATVTGSARPVEKDAISEDDLAIITGVRPDGSGALVRHVQGKSNDPPSSEAVEMIELDLLLPQIELPPVWNIPQPVPISRSFLHGHRGIAAYHPQYVEFVPLDPPYYFYPVSCATEAQARGIKAAFSRSETLHNFDDPRQVAFTVLPGHGVVIVEKWVHGKQPFQTIYEYMDAGFLQVDNRVPQGWVKYTPGSDGRMHLNLSRSK